MLDHTSPAMAPNFNICFPQQGSSTRQDEEWFEFELNGQTERLRIHDYAGIYSVPGLYEALVYETLECRSPYRLSNLLMRAAGNDGVKPETLNVLDLGAGNGVVAEELQEIGINKFVGLDLIPEAESAARRDRPSLYSDYVVGDVRDLSQDQRAAVSKARLNTLVTVAALGFGDIPPSALTAALKCISPRGWLGMTIKEEFLDVDARSGFGNLLNLFTRHGILEVCARERYCHRLSVAGDPIFYVALVARKLKQVPDSVVAKVNEEDGWAPTGESQAPAKFGT